jgi:hypothetical protein
MRNRSKAISMVKSPVAGMARDYGFWGEAF